MGNVNGPTKFFNGTNRRSSLKFSGTFGETVIRMLSRKTDIVFEKKQNKPGVDENSTNLHVFGVLYGSQL